MAAFSPQESVNIHGSQPSKLRASAGEAGRRTHLLEFLLEFSPYGWGANALIHMGEYVPVLVLWGPTFVVVVYSKPSTRAPTHRVLGNLLSTRHIAKVIVIHIA